MVVPFSPRFIGKDPPSKDGDSPSVWVDEADGSLVFQLWQITDETEVAALMCASSRDDVPGHEVLGRLPVTMFALLQEAMDASRAARPDTGSNTGPGAREGSDTG